MRDEPGAEVAAVTGGTGAGEVAGPGPAQRLGLPESGPGSSASAGQRIAGLLVDILLSALVAGLFTAPQLPKNWSLVAFAAEYLLFTAAFGQTPGMRLTGVRVVRLDRPARLYPQVRIGLWRSAVRTLGVVLLVPALIWGADGRCLHDRITGTAVVRTRSAG